MLNQVVSKALTRPGAAADFDLKDGARERQMRRFTSAAQLQRFASVHGIVQTLFQAGRHLLRSAHHRLLRTRAFVEWAAVTCIC